jgi:hypothetical protein
MKKIDEAKIPWTTTDRSFDDFTVTANKILRVDSKELTVNVKSWTTK